MYRDTHPTEAGWICFLIMLAIISNGIANLGILKGFSSK